MTTIHERIASAGITAEVKPSNAPAPEGFAKGSTSWRVTLHNPVTGRRMTVPFHMGPANTEPPTAAEVLDVLVSEATSYRNADGFEDFATDFGYDLDDYPARRRAQRIYNACRRVDERLTPFLGDDFDAFAYETERP